MTKPELKACPFCGSRAELYTIRNDDDAPTMYRVSCCANDSCYHGTEGVIDDWCPADCETTEFPTEAEAIAAWNTRPDVVVLNENEKAAIRSALTSWQDGLYDPIRESLLTKFQSQLDHIGEASEKCSSCGKLLSEGCTCTYREESTRDHN